jgi:hypothetical protein
MNWRAVLVIGFVGIGMWMAASIFAGAADGDLDDPQRGKTVVVVKSTATEVEALRVALGDKAVEALKPRAIEEGVELQVAFDQAARMRVDLFQADSNKLTAEQLLDLAKLSRTVQMELERNKLPLEEHPRVRAFAASGIARATQSSQQDFVISGTVVNQDGEPLDGVEVRVYRSQMISFGRNKNELITTGVVNAKFMFRVPSAHHVSVRFHKEGYFDHQIYEAFNVDNQRWLTAFKGLNVGPAKVTVREERVVLDKHETVTNLVPSKGRLEHRADGSALVAALDANGIRLIEVKDVEQAQKDVPIGLALSAPIKDGKFETTELTIPRGPTDPYPIKITLTMQGQDAGLVRHQPPKVSASEWVLDRMPQAPNEGYEEQLVIKAEDLIGEVYFFFKSNGRYGKGFYCWTKVKNESALITGQVFLRIQPNEGDRNLNTRRQ